MGHRQIPTSSRGNILILAISHALVLLTIVLSMALASLPTAMLMRRAGF